MAVRSTRYARGGSGKNNSRSINTILSDFKRFAGVVDEQAERIMGDAADIVLRHTLPLTPEATGALRSSGRTFTIKTGKGYAGVVTFGGPDNPVTPTPNAPTGIVNYAIMVHEDLERSYNVGGPKYLERGAMSARKEVDDYVVNELRKIKP
jgi:hypothetical protein